MFAALALQGIGARADHPGVPLKQTLAGAEVDWGAGTITASGGAAADLRMPSVDLARPGAQRRAHAAAVAKLRGALGLLPLGSGNKLSPAEIERALGQARDVDVQYQSNGGAIVRAEIRFGDWLETRDQDATLAIKVSSIRLSAAPTARIGGKDVRVGSARYQMTDANVVKNVGDAKVDDKGRILLAGPTHPPEKLARGSLLIYVVKVLR